MDIEEIGSVEALQALEPAWRGLYARSPQASPFQSPAWLLSWIEAFRPAEPWALAVRTDGRLVGLAPFFVYTDPQTGARQLTLLGNGISDRLDLLAEPQAMTGAADAVFAHLARRADCWDRLDWRDLPQTSALLSGPLPPGLRESVEAEEPCPARPLRATPQAVVAALPRKRRENIGRRGRRLAELGTVAVRAADREGLACDLQALLDLHGARWEGRGEAGVLAADAVQAFHRRAAPRLLEAGLLRLHLLTLDGTTIAAHYGFQRGACAYSYIHGFDPAYAPYGPSTLLIAAAMEDAVRAGADTFDFLRGREGYKYDWGGLDLPQRRRRAWR